MLRLLSVVFSFTCLIPISNADEPRQSRWENAIVAFEKADRESTPAAGPVVFTGSSSIRRWPLDQFFPTTRTLNRGFGGSQMSDLIAFADRIVTPFQPSAIVVYSGDNDIAAGRSPERVRNDFLTFVGKVQSDGQPTIVLIGVKPSERRWNLRKKLIETNRLLSEACENEESLTFIDVYGLMLGEDGRPDPELYAADKLHLSDKGYQKWQALVATALDRFGIETAGETTP
ncbi:GDSL-type esterase/lipase family protein [Stratiformator vulcanicus]|uniref:GDSL-like Lipase/Acylhydrolase n=1 Tax=Stratiformator vulcanicus TaxID=2527980 RepID=A0A517R1L5_9PLAN|nr:GDSL-type esterase/lipase family protein [Stratiformator vulcanicus]QDT37795.1 GDSL-like Lipase/Acylhydrolase [Stratiformator vulcanicus]